MRTCLVNPPSPFLIDPMMMPPLGLWYLWPVLEEAGHEVTFVDLNEDDLPEDQDAYLVTCTTPHARFVKELIAAIPPDKRVVIGGPHATLLPREVSGWRKGVTAILGEGEGCIDRALTLGSDMVWAKRLTCKDFLSIPIPDRSQAHRYKWETDTPDGSVPTTTLVSSRGCPHRCAFCAHALWGGRVVYLPYIRVGEELEDIASLGFGAVAFYDSSLTLDPTRVMVLGDLCRVRGLWWRCFVRADAVSRLLIQGMAERGCVEVGIGIESGSQTVLDNIHKGTTVEQNTEAVRLFQEHGIRVKAYLVLGLPGETEETMEATRRWILEVRPDRMDLACAVPFPGTPMVEEGGYDLQFGLDGDWSDHFWKARRGETRAHTWTSALTPERILEKREEILDEAGIPY